MVSKDSILYIDDEQINLDSFNFIFNKEYTIHLAVSTIEAEAILEHHKVKLVITDQKMPKETGLDFIERIKPKYPDIIFIVVTGYANSEMILDAFNNKGIYYFIPKPWEVNDMRQILANAVEKYNLSLQNKELLVTLKNTNKQLQEQNEFLRSLTLSLKDSESKFKNLFYSSFEAICIINEEGLIIEANSAFCTMIDIEKSMLTQMSFYEIIDTEYQLFFKERHKELLDFGETKFEVRLQKRAKKVVHIEMLAKKIVYENCRAFMVVSHNLTERMLTQQEILKSSVMAEETERSRIAQDLHDGIGPLLTSIKLFSETLINTDKPELILMLEKQIIESLDDAIDQVSAISNNLSPHILKNFGIEQAVKKFCQNITNSTNVTIRQNITIGQRIQEEIEVTLYRLVIELINNTLKHANAGSVDIEMWQDENKLFFTYSDDGVGLDDYNFFQKKGGMGLFNLKNRVEAMQGIFSYKSAKDKGVAYYIRLPLELTPYE